MREGIQIGPIIIRYYALIIMAGVIVAAWLSTGEAKRREKDGEMIWDMLPWIVIGGILGARIWHILTPPASMVEMGLTTNYYFTHPLEMLAIWKGGLGIPGAVIGGALALWIYTRKHNDSFLEWADIVAPGLALAQAIGRWGNFVNQEVYGSPSDLPWAIKIDPLHRLPGFETVETYHPLFLYESLLNILVAGILLLVGRKYKNKLFKGDIFFLYLVLYPLIRFGLEFLRLDPSPVAGLNINQTFMAVVVIAASVLLILRHTIWAEKIATSQVKFVEEQTEEKMDLQISEEEVETAVLNQELEVDVDELSKDQGYDSLDEEQE